MRNALTIASTTSSSNEKPGVALPSLARQDDTANRTTSKRAFARAIEASAKLDVASPDAVLVSRTPTSASKRNVLHAMAAGNRSARGLSATEAASTICTEETFGAPQPLTRRPSSAGDHPLPKKFFSSPGANPHVFSALSQEGS